MVRLLGLALALALVWSAAAFAADEKKASPEPGPKVGQKWEYAELHFTAASTRPVRGGMGAPGGAGGAGGAGGVGGPGAPGGRVVRVAATTVRWVTGEGETEADGWEGLATKMKAPAAAKGATPVAHKLKLLNHLGAQGWELVSSTTTVMTFKRKAAR
jgi:hypothetical protein